MSTRTYRRNPPVHGAGRTRAALLGLVTAVLVLLPATAHAAPGPTILDRYSYARVGLINDHDLIEIEDWLGGGTVELRAPGMEPIDPAMVPEVLATNPYNDALTAMNNDGDAVGYDTGVGFVFSLDTMRKTRLDHGGAGIAFPNAIAEDGTIGGYVRDEFGGATHAAVWTGPERRLQLLAGDGCCSQVLDVNGRGLAVGTVGASTSSLFTVWDWRSGAVTDLSSAVAPGTFGGAAVNDQGQVLVHAERPGGTQGHVVDLATGQVTTFDVVGSPTALRLNERGEVLYVRPDLALVRLNVASGEATTLLPPGSGLRSFALNDVGQVLYSVSGDDGGRSTLIDPTHGTIDLGPAYRDLVPEVLNNTGLIGGRTTTAVKPFLDAVPIVPAALLEVRGRIDANLVSLAWDPAPQPGIRPTTSFQIVRDGVVVGEVGPDAGSWSAPIGADPAEPHTYAVLAVNVVGASAPSELVLQAQVVAPVGTPIPVAVVVQPRFTG